MPIILSIALTAFMIFGQVSAAEQLELKKTHKNQNERQRLSYSLGYDTGSQMKANSVDIDPEIFIKAFREAVAGKKPAMTDQEMREAMQPLQKQMAVKRAEAMQKRAEAIRQLADKNKQEGEIFLAANATKEGVVALPSGLQYKVKKEGTGKIPGKSDQVKVHYRGSFLDGTEFDSSYKRGQPAAFAADKVIKGWSEALQLMKEGSQWMLYVPSQLAYGEQGFQGKIGPNQALVFEVDLISVQ